jgi:hypothetical protein
MSDSTLEYLAVCEARDRNPAGDAEMFALERVGLVVLKRAGWGHYEVRLTQAGHARVREIEASRSVEEERDQEPVTRRRRPHTSRDLLLLLKGSGI